MLFKQKIQSGSHRFGEGKAGQTEDKTR